MGTRNSKAKKTRESYFQRAQPLAKEKKPGIRKKKNPRIVLPEGPVPGKGKKTRNSKEKKPANRTSRGPSPWQRKKSPEFERKKNRESYFQRAQSLAKEKKPGIRKKKNLRIVLPDGPVPGEGKEIRNSK